MEHRFQCFGLAAPLRYKGVIGSIRFDISIQRTDKGAVATETTCEFVRQQGHRIAGQKA